MGLIGKSMILLESITESSITAATITVPKLLNWFNVLLTGLNFYYLFFNYFIENDCWDKT